MRNFLQRCQRHWVARCAGAGAVSTVVDVGVLLAALAVGVAPVPASVIGVLVGSVVSFALNKYFAFRDGTSPLLPQLGRYVATLAVAAAVHALLMWVLAVWARAPVLFAKLLADVLVFGCGNLWAMRFVVFPLEPEDPTSTGARG